MMNTKIKSHLWKLKIKKRESYLEKVRNIKGTKQLSKKMIKRYNYSPISYVGEEREKKLIENSIPEIEILERGKKIDV